MNFSPNIEVNLEYEKERPAKTRGRCREDNPKLPGRLYPAGRGDHYQQSIAVAVCILTRMMANVTGNASIPPEREFNGSVLAALRSGTADLHEQVEKRVDVDRLTSSVEAYAETLAAFYGFYRPFESFVGQAPRERFDFALLPRAVRIADDLHRLGFGTGIATIPQCSDFPPVVTRPSLIGALYVIEGAALGGKVISRLVRDRLGIDSSAGGSFFSGDGEIGRRWNDFQEAAEAATLSTMERVETVNTARKTFAAFNGWLALCTHSQVVLNEKERMDG